MKIAVSSQGNDISSLVDSRFGRAHYFYVLDCVTGEHTVVDNEAGVNAAQGAGTQAVQVLASMDVEAVITGHVGPKAWTALKVAKIPAYAAQQCTVDEAVQAFRAGKLSLIDNAA